MPQRLAALALAASLYLLGGCGQTGPLYLPGEAPPQRVPDGAIDADGEQSQDIP